tara:strand:- start:17237 stop:18214 length:978 start_codon:yes stop_codon:yes gene_type:complete
MNPLISIIIPNFNREHLISETLESVRNQTYEHWECIIVDDHSTDESWAVVEKFCESDERFKQVKRPNSLMKGACGCRNYGFELSKGTYINWFDSDDIMLPQKLEKQILAAEHNKSDLVVCQTQFFEHQVTNIKHFWNTTFTPKYDPLTDYITFRLAWSPNAALWKKSFLENKKLFDPVLTSSQDWEFNIRLLTFNPSFSFESEIFVLNRIHSKRIGALNTMQQKSMRLTSRLNIFDDLKEKNILNNEIKGYFKSFFLNQLNYFYNKQEFLNSTLFPAIKSSTTIGNWYFNIFPRIVIYLIFFRIFGKRHLTYKYLIKQKINEGRI